MHVFLVFRYILTRENQLYIGSVPVYDSLCQFQFSFIGLFLDLE